MGVSEKEVEELARISRLALRADEIKRYAQDIEALEKLAESLLSVEKIELPDGEGFSLEDLRDDVANPCLLQQDVLRLAPEKTDAYVRVPRTVEEA